MSSSNSPDPRLLLPDWLRDGDALLPPATVPPASVAFEEASADEAVDVVAVRSFAPAETESVQAPASVAVPYSDRLTLDTRLDPGQLVSNDDLPIWLGGLERSFDLAAPIQVATAVPAATSIAAPIAAPEPYEGVDAPEDGVIDVQVNGWYLVAGAIGLLALLAAALRLYLS